MHLSFKRTTRDNLYTRVGRVGLTVYKTRIGDYAWRMRGPDGKDAHSPRGFASERECLEDLLDNVAEMVTIAAVLAEEDHDDDFA